MIFLTLFGQVEPELQTGRKAQISDLRRQHFTGCATSQWPQWW